MTEVARRDRSAYQRAYYLANRERTDARARAWRQAHPEKIAAYNRAYHEARREKRAAYDRARQLAHPATYAERAARRRAQKAAAPRVEKIDRAYIIARDKSLCHICGEKVTNDLHLDHLVPLSKGGTHTHDNLAVAHATCNLQRSDGRLPAQLLLIG